MADNHQARNMVIRRPASLAEVARWSLDDGNFDMNLRDFLHEFKARTDFQMLREEPALLRGRFAYDGTRDAYLAATAAFLARQSGREAPTWTFGDTRFLKRPWFASDWPGLRVHLLRESPPEFRERNLFISENGIDVC